MLVLTRCPGRGNLAVICIGHDIEIAVLGIEDDQVQVAVTAPPSLTISCDSPPRDLPAPRVDKARKRPVY
jgi:carbon storage regulator CsrA